MLLGALAADELTLPANQAGVVISGLSSDSRTVKPGFLFAALAGSAADGAAFARDAVERGAVAVLAGLDADLDIPADIVVIRSDDPRRALARFAARFHPRQPVRIAGVTGTSGKTSVVHFTRQILAAAGRNAASVGTLGILTAQGLRKGSLTTPETVALHAELERLARDGVTDLAIEASSHGLDQRRLDGLALSAAAFTNLGRDHLDYHADEAAYFAAKLRLFTELLPADGTAVVDMDTPYGARVAEAVRDRGQALLAVGHNGAEIRLDNVDDIATGQAVDVRIMDRPYHMVLPLPGRFQVANTLVAIGLAMALEVEPEVAVAAAGDLVGAPGRLELVGRKANGASVFVDYAHKPEALSHALTALRPMTHNRLVVVFGAGGDRDRGKRPLMAAAAAAHADVVIVTDDNPRSEDPARIRKEVLAGASGALEIGDRGEAVGSAVAMLEAGDVLCVAGKGHETGQIVGNEVLPFSDHEAVRAALAGAAA